MSAVKKTAQNAQKAASALALLSSEKKAKALEAMAAALLKNSVAVLKANAKDVAAAKARKMAPALVARLTLDESKVKKIAESLVSISKLNDPVGRILSQTVRPNGLVIKKVGVPIGVILIIYESRPNVTADCMALCLKSGNAVILKGGSEAQNSNVAIFNVLQKAAVEAGVPKSAFSYVAGGRAEVAQLLQLNEQIDLVIPRGGEGLIREVARISKIPVIKHYKGICHVYVDKDADLDKALKITVNAKAQNPSVCNAAETLLVHEDVAGRFLPKAGDALRAKNVELRGDVKTLKLLPGIKKATEKDWATEYLDLILSVRVVKNLDQAIEHIGTYGSKHSDAIITENVLSAEKFTAAVDSACVFVNASTRFNDGGEFGMGAEMGISTDKLHARGPMGLEELTTYKYLVVGSGQVRG